MTNTAEITAAHEIVRPIIADYFGHYKPSRRHNLIENAEAYLRGYMRSGHIQSLAAERGVCIEIAHAAAVAEIEEQAASYCSAGEMEALTGDADQVAPTDAEDELSAAVEAAFDISKPGARGVLRTMLMDEYGVDSWRACEIATDASRVADQVAGLSRSFSSHELLSAKSEVVENAKAAVETARLHRRSDQLARREGNLFDAFADPETDEMHCEHGAALLEDVRSERERILTRLHELNGRKRAV